VSGFKPQDVRYTKLVDQYSRYIKSPVLRLKFLNNALQTGAERRGLSRLPLLRKLPHRAMLIVELSKVLPPAERAPLALRFTSLLYRLRYGIYAVCLMLAAGAGVGLIYTVSKVATALSTATEAKDKEEARPQAADPAAAGDAVKAIGSEAGPALDRVWLAEQGEGYEFYSNGARMLTGFETTGAKRKFYRFTLDGLVKDSDSFEMLATPVGIVYHLSESDLLPFADSFNSSLQDRSRALLEYARDNRLYNYVIDRFGRTYRIVRDEYTASHAGNSLWSDSRGVYVNLSASFIGVCFEGKTVGGENLGPEGINEAQIYAARILTAVLRSKYAIDDANCVTHGLVSVNPSNKLMGYHTDWVSGFPFEAVGLSNKYGTELIAISRFGFTYDQTYIEAAGGAAWPGLERASVTMRERAEREGRAVEEDRRAQWRLFQRAYLKQHALDQKKVTSDE
jgi:N-acetylmuramoyl-L-alanine amidase-like protein